MDNLPTGGMVEALQKLSNGDGDEKPKAVDNKVRTDWNDFLASLDKKGMRGKPELDKGGVGYQLFDEYVKNNPKTSLNRDMLPVIRKEMLNYRQWVLDQAKQGKVKLADGVSEDNFMKNIVDNEKTGDPNYPGSNLSGLMFPTGYLSTFMNDKKIKGENTGFVVPAK